MYSRFASLTRCCRNTRLFSTRVESSIASTGLPQPRLDYRDIFDNVVYKSHNAFNRKANIPVGAIQSVARLYEQQKELSSNLNYKRSIRSDINDRIRANSKNPEAKQAALAEAKSLKADIAELEEQLSNVEDRLHALALTIPNNTHPLSPIGPESAAVTLSQHGPPPMPATASRDHLSIGRTLGLVNFEAGATVTGSSWYYLLNEGALLELALINYSLSIAIKHGYKFTTTPDVVRTEIAYRCGFQPRDQQNGPASQMYHIAQPSVDNSSQAQSPELVLAGTAEIPLAGMFANHIFAVHELPVKVVGLGRAFRAEAGARGADTRGLYRVHQFSKLELFVVSDEQHSETMMEEMRVLQTEIFEGLGLSFRVLDMPTEELGASAYRKYDMEAWMPGRGSWGEISSTSNCTDYQARRLHIRYRRAAPSLSSSGAQQPTSTQPSSLPFTHTLNGTAAAVPRLIVALLENGARFDDAGAVIGVDLPKALQPFWVTGSAGNLIRWV